MPANIAQPQTPEQSPLARALAARIRRDGPMSVAAFMAEAAQYYYANQKVFGQGGDFTTAPEITQLFGEMIALWLTDLWLNMGRPERIQLIELGPGRGTLAADIMRTIRAWPEFSIAVTLHLVESSPRLRDEQARTLAGLAAPVWYERLEDVPQGLSFIVANEFLDALPVHQFEKTSRGWMERCVDIDQTAEAFCFSTRPLPAGVSIPPAFAEAPSGSIFEISPDSLDVMQTLANRLRTGGGAALIIDYGHDQPGLGDTLQALEDHAYADVLGNPGARDITAHVDFMTCAQAAGEGIRLHGPVTQAAFLQRLGIAARAELLSEKADPSVQSELASGLMRLIDPAQMGKLFKVMALTSADLPLVPAGFSDDTGGAEREDSGATHG